jgi:iron complex transport system permease protein
MNRLKPRPVLRFGRFAALPWHRPSLVAGLAIAVVALVLCGVTLTGGSYGLDLPRLLGALRGEGSATDAMVVWELRLPRMVAAMLVGAALGASGAIFQGLSRNPLASPDLLGFTTGAASGALVVIVLMGETTLGVMLGSAIGGFATAAIAYVVAIARGLRGDRLILVGVALGAMLSSMNDWLLTRADLETAQAAKVWLFGSLHAIGWPAVTGALLAVAVLLPLAGALSVRLRLIEMGEAMAAGLGVPVERTRLMLLAVATLLAAAAIAAAGPVGFVALAAPQLARRMTRAPGMGIAVPALLGAALVLGADLAGQRLLAPFQIPAGLVTGALGGFYLAALLLIGRGR